MNTKLFCLLLCTFVGLTDLRGLEPPQNLTTQSGDQSIIIRWDRLLDTNVSAYRVFRALSPDGPFTAFAARATVPCFADTRVTNGITYHYKAAGLDRANREGPHSSVIQGQSQPFAKNDEFLDYVQRTAFDYFWYEANPANGLVPDRSSPGSACSIAAVGFGLTAIGIGIDHGWITRSQGLERVTATLNTFVSKPKGTNTSGTIGHRGWFYHFLDMRAATRFASFNTELSSIDTALLMAGVIYAREYFSGNDARERTVRVLADQLLSEIDWHWMARGTNVLSMGWHPRASFLNAKWEGYNEASILYILGLGAETNPLPASAWERWCSTYDWATNFGQQYVEFPPLFGHQYSQCWLDLRHIADPYMRQKASSYFENSRRATIAQRAYCIANRYGHRGYGTNVWGITASDGPSGYSARGAPPPENDDGTIAPTAAGGSMPFAPEYCVPALREMYDKYRVNIWSGYGFRDAFNVTLNWWATDVLGIDQGPILLMIENHRTGSVWRHFMKNQQVQRGLERAGFKPLPFLAPKIQALPQQSGARIWWDSPSTNFCQVEFSPDLESWFFPVGGQIRPVAGSAEWVDAGPPATPVDPADVPGRFYRVFRFGD